MTKVKTFLQLSEGERSKIEVLLNAGFSLSVIARTLNRSTSTISREVKRNGCVVYKAPQAQMKTVRRHRLKPKHVIFDQGMKCFIVNRMVKQRWTPELICIDGRRWRPDFVSHEWIYRWVWAMKFSQAKDDQPYTHLYEYLRHASRRRKRGRKRNMRGNILGRQWIDQRPWQATRRTQPGHLEGDIILGKERQPGALVVLDRMTRKSWVRKLETKDATYVVQKLKDICLQAQCKTLTLDNDQSFALHYKLQDLGIKTFFTHPYSSQEKGSVENRIGLIRMFFPKKTEFNKVTSGNIKRVENLINNRPMRMFNYQTPNEIHEKLQPLH